MLTIWSGWIETGSDQSRWVASVKVDDLAIAEVSNIRVATEQERDQASTYIAQAKAGQPIPTWINPKTGVPWATLHPSRRASLVRGDDGQWFARVSVTMPNVVLSESGQAAQVMMEEANKSLRSVGVEISLPVELFKIAVGEWAA